MLDVIPCTTCEANEVRAELDAVEALCEPCSQGIFPKPLNRATMNDPIIKAPEAFWEDYFPTPR